MRILILSILLMLTLFRASAQIQGTFANYYGTKLNPAYPFQLVEIHQINPGKIFFYLEVGRGAPDYNSGALYGTLTLNKKSGNYEYIPKDTVNNCKLVFIRYNNKLIIKTVNGDCPFGYGVTADGIYKLTSKKNPQYFIDREDKKINFDKTPPDKYFP
jgi:hypothetical protein